MVRVLVILLVVLTFLGVQMSFATEDKVLSEFLYSIKTLSADFVQHSADGTRTTGEIFLSLPHKSRIDYPKEGISILMNKGMVTYYDAPLKESRKFFTGKSDPFLLMMANLGNLSQYKHFRRGRFLYLEKSSNNKKCALVLQETPPRIRELIFEDNSGQAVRIVLSNVRYNISPRRNLFNLPVS